MELIAYDNEGKIYFTLGDKTEAQLEESQADQDGAIEELAGLVTGEE